ncbi:hypothetical protein SLEP1_g24867 [Rubroshorea leprosula]|uniref:Protein FAR1-RELATED SEQUENCE n=1 Tax=Rubroshorea leprosula TaxID=152421 RepID=A0AAV5JRG1_9ROSI|nr:hypothetical protein SLEP1_g24867 [Rubroshorea leprosula]
MSGEDDITSWMPHERMQFPSEKEAREFYNEYARRVGFSIRTESSKRSTSYGPVDRKYYVCYKAGKKRPYVPKYKPSCERPIQETREVMDQYKLARCGPSKIARLLNVTGQVMQQFLEVTASDENFYHSMELDEDGVCRSMFWVDGRVREMYQHFDETEATFVWLLKRWLSCMGGKESGAIITDQDPTITNAIKKVFPNTPHRFCMWHISLHADEHLRSLRSSYNPGFDEQYYKWVKSSKTIEEAESAWKELKDKYKHEFVKPLTDKQHNEMKSWKWLENMYEQRYSWVDVYLRDTFFAGMRSSQRSESINSFFDAYVNSKTPLSEFVGQYTRALQSWRDQEVNEDMQTMKVKPNPLNLHLIEVQVGNIYTRKFFDKFQSEFKACFYCMHDEVNTCDEVTTYVVTYGLGKMVDSQFVRCGPSVEEFACICGKFETVGILCKPILYIMKLCHRMKEIPKCYILVRWTLTYRQHSKKTACESSTVSKDLVVSPLESWNLRKSFMEVHEQAIGHRDQYNAMVPLLEDMMKQLDRVNKQYEGLVLEQNASTSAISQGAILSNITIRDPERAKTKGRPRELGRIPFGKQVSQKASQARTRTCSMCDIKGHDARTCGKTKEKVATNDSLSQPLHEEE